MIDFLRSLLFPDREEGIPAVRPEGFRVPEAPIIATHYFAQGWAIDLWSYLDPARVDEDLAHIRAAGFNTVILLIPWCGFQPQIDPITYYPPYLERLDFLLRRTQAHGLQVILRLGYAHDNGPPKDVDGFHRAISIGHLPKVMRAWEDFLDTVWKIAGPFAHVLGGFISWEDFFLMDITHAEPEQRLQLAKLTGYQDYLAEHYSLSQLNAIYQARFSALAEVPIPAFRGKGVELFSRFWDHLLVSRVFEVSRRHFPRLTMEVRVDGEPLEKDGAYCQHHDTFAIADDVPLTMIYYSPAWGAPNQGEAEPIDAVIDRLEYLLKLVRNKSGKAIFIDQFNFIDNTPGFEENSRLASGREAEFLNRAGDVLGRHSLGYGLWSIKDVPANIIRNGLFQYDYPAWELEAAALCEDAESGRRVLRLETGGVARQALGHCAGAHFLPGRPFTLRLVVKAVDGACLRISGWDDNQTRTYEHDLNLAAGDAWHSVLLEDLELNQHGAFVIANLAADLLVAEVYLYQFHQENGVYDAGGQAKPFYSELLSLNDQLAGARPLVAVNSICS